MLTRAFIHDANQCLHVIRLAAEALALEHGEGRLTPDRLARRVDAILGQVEHLGALISDSPTPSGPDAPPVLSAPTQPATAAQVLVVEDEVLAAMMLADHLRHAGYAVQLAHDGVEACARCRETIFDAIVTDIRMPRMDGFQLLRHLQDLQPETPVIVASGHVRPEQAAALPECVVEVVAKPFSPSRISDILATVAPPPPPPHGD